MNLHKIKGTPLSKVSAKRLLTSFALRNFLQWRPLFQNSPLDCFEIHPLRSASQARDFALCGERPKGFRPLDTWPAVLSWTSYRYATFVQHFFINSFIDRLSRKAHENALRLYLFSKHNPLLILQHGINLRLSLWTAFILNSTADCDILITT